MARTFHHSQKYGESHRFNRADIGFPCGYRRGEAPSWFVRVNDTRPQRRRDAVTLHDLRFGLIDPDAVCWAYTGTKRPHRYYW